MFIEITYKSYYIFVLASIVLFIYNPDLTGTNTVSSIGCNAKVFFIPLFLSVEWKRDISGDNSDILLVNWLVTYSKQRILNSQWKYKFIV